MSNLQTTPVPLDRLLVVALVHTNDALAGLAPVLRAVPHRKRTGVVLDARPLLAPEIRTQTLFGLDVRRHAMDSGAARARHEVLLTLHVEAAWRLMRHAGIDGVLVVGLRGSFKLMEGIVHARQLDLILAVRSKQQASAQRLADRVIDVDAIASKRGNA